jgi:hypothetical protein
MWKTKGADGVGRHRKESVGKEQISNSTANNQPTIFVTLSPGLSLISGLSTDLMAKSYFLLHFPFASFASVVNNMLVGGCDATTVGANWMANGYVADNVRSLV